MHSNLIVIKLSGDTPEHLTATIHTPNYPGPYPRGNTLVWHVHTKAGYQLSFELLDMDLQFCCENIIVHDGSSLAGTQLVVLTGARFVVGAVQAVSSGSEMTVRFKSTSLIDKRGFSALIRVSLIPVITTTAAPPSIYQCGPRPIKLVADGVERHFYSPNYPKNYPNDACIEWLIETKQPVGYVVELTVNNLNVEYDNIDFVFFVDAITRNVRAYLNCQSGFGVCFKKRVVSQSNTMLVRFKSDSADTFPGFDISYRQVFYPKARVEITDEGTFYTDFYVLVQHCDYTARGGNFKVVPLSDAYIRTRGYHRGRDYPLAITCTWLITATGYTRHVLVGMNLAFKTTLDLEAGKDFVEVYNGPDRTGNKLAHYTGKYACCETGVVYSEPNTPIFIVFHSDANVTGPGFLIHFFTSVI